MNTSSRALMLAFGLALAMLAVSTLVAAITLTGASQQVVVSKGHTSRNEPRSFVLTHAHRPLARDNAFIEDTEDHAHQSPGLRF